MTRFLQAISEYLINKHEENFENVWLVFPNRRSGVFLKHYLINALQNPVWSPKIVTINQLLSRISDIQLADKLTLIGDLYKAFLEQSKTSDTFDEFFHWGEILLNDFIDIDKNLVDTRDLFQNLIDLKELEDNHSYLSPKQIKAIQEFWATFEAGPNSGVEENFLSIWKILPAIYAGFNNRMERSGYGHEGKSYRAAANQDIREAIKDLKIQHIYFIGFNALTVSEKQIFNNFKKTNIAEFIYDYDHFYLDNLNHEAGVFIRENLKERPQSETFKHFISTSSKIKEEGWGHSFKNIKEITSYQASSKIGQVKLVNQLLKAPEHNSQVSPDKTAIILPDESLLEPLLNSIPSRFNNVNITMGYPVKNTPAYLLFEQLVDLIKTSKLSKSGNRNFYFQTVIALINHPYIKESYPKETELLQAQIIETKKYSMNLAYISQVFPILNDKLNVDPTKPDYLEWLSNFFLWILELLQAKKQQKTYLFDKEYTIEIIKTLNRTKEILSNLELEVLPPTILKVLRQALSKAAIPFKGEPLKGIQIAGVLETRLLDFEEVVILSMNEGVFPKSRVGSSYIPYTLRKGFDLPTIDHSDAIASYYFYRLLQRASKVHLVHTSNAGPIGIAEMNRYLYQLKYDTSIKLKEIVVKPQIKIAQPTAITITRTADINKILSKFTNGTATSHRLSPTAINQWIDCKLKFYYKYVAGLKAPEEIDEEVDAAVFGNILHQSIQLIYENKTLISADEIDNILKNKEFINNQILKAFTELYFKKEATVSMEEIQGSLILAFETIKKYVIQILKTDKRHTPFTIIGLEKAYELNAAITNSSDDLVVKIGGTIDRIDNTNGVVRIIDYKTGKDEKSIKTIDELFDDTAKQRKRGILQVLLYATMFNEQTSMHKLSPCIYSVKDIFSKDFNPQIQINKQALIYDDVKEEYRGLLNQTLSDIFNPQIAFSQTENRDLCRYCDYRSICNRQ